MTDYEKARYEDAKLAHKALMKYYPLEITDLDGEEWRDIDGCKMNNFVGNLEWLTRAENNQHAARIGLMKSGSEHKDAQLTDEQVAWCRSVHISGDLEYGTNALARKLNVSPSAMYLILHEKSYKNVK